MPRPSWSGHLRVSLVTCPIALAPATSEADRIRLNQINPKTGNRISLKPVGGMKIASPVSAKSSFRP